MAENLSIKKFVRQVLGCTCPDKVFEQIDDRRTASSALPHTRSITIGDRLLIYIWEVNEIERFKKNFLAMLAAGRKERDEQGLNRFRAVLAVNEMTHGIAAEADLHFSRFTGRDERMHLHVIPGSVFHNL